MKALAAIIEALTTELQALNELAMALPPDTEQQWAARYAYLNTAKAIASLDRAFAGNMM